jgi:hypothetical protein
MEAVPEEGGARWRVLRLLAGVAAGLAIGFALEHFVASRLVELDRAAHQSYEARLAARAEAANLLDLVAVGLFGSTAGLGVAIVLSGRRSLALQEFPPPGAWSWGGRRKLSGPRALAFAKVSIGLGVALVLTSAAGGGLVWYMAAVVRACKR